MHELSLVEGIVDLIAEEARARAFSRVRVIHVSVGALGGAEPEALRFCFDAVARGTIADGARLEIRTVPALGWCSECSRQTPLAERFSECPACGRAPLRILAGDELRLSELEVE